MAINKAIVVGNVGAEPKVTTFQDGKKAVQFSIATTERAYTLQNGTQVPERTEWHNIVAWGKQAEIIEKYVHKGSKLYVEGKMHTRSYDDKQNVRHYTFEIHLEILELLDSRQQVQQAPVSNGNTQQGQPQASASIPPKDDLPF
jgi:single-strand DNA-binding protein